MIENLKYSVTFPSSLRQLKQNLDFTKGSTAITGPNETGKSFVVEMIRFGFCGTAALRGKSEDYDTLDMSMTWSMKGNRYQVERKIDKAKLLENDVPIAVGVRPVNAKILALLGYGLDVFDVAHVTLQGEVERLGSLKPTERKALVDKTIGLDKMDDITKWCSDQGTLLGREIEVLQRGLVEPIEPRQPDEYEPSAGLTSVLQGWRALKAEQDQLKGWLSQVTPKPIMPVRPLFVETLEALEATLCEIDTVAAERKHILALPIVDFDEALVRQQWDAYDLWASRINFEALNPRASAGMTQEKIEGLLADHAACAELSRLQGQLSKLQASPKMTCPSCSTEFCVEHSAAAEVEKQIAAITDTGVVQPAISVATLRAELGCVRLWETPAVLAKWDIVKDAVDTAVPEISKAQLADAKSGITSFEQATRLGALPKLPERQEIATKIADLQRWLAAVVVYEQTIGVYDVWVAEQAVKEARVRELNQFVSLIPTYEARLTESLQYESSRDKFLLDQAAYETRKDELNTKQQEWVGWKTARQFLSEVRARIKTYLIPSLSKVASHLLTQMTGGQRSSIVINEDFDITVDGQELETLSGSGKACANLALRIGLGQVLTNNVLSIFIGDEIDGSMDDERANFTRDSIQSLTNRISQIILITHKCPTTDNVVSLAG